jgi:drug/metabolite transporter (DMT)-like permease
MNIWLWHNWRAALTFLNGWAASLTDKIDARTETPQRYRLAWAVAPFVFVMLWSGGYSFAKLGLAHAEPLTLLALRYGLAILAFLLVLAFYRPVWPRELRHWTVIAITGFLIQCVYFGLAYLAMKQGMHAGTTAIIMALQPMLVAIALSIMSRRQTNTLIWLGLVLGFCGVLLVVWSDGGLGPSNWTATSLSVAALIGIAGATVFEKWHQRKTDPVVGGLVQYVVGLAVVLPAAALSESMVIDWQPNLIISLAYLVIANSVISIGLYMALLQRGDATRISSLMYLVPPLAILTAWVILGEPFGVLTLAGLALSIAGVYTVSKQTA